jgi:hypothetical protein
MDFSFSADPWSLGGFWDEICLVSVCGGDCGRAAWSDLVNINSSGI